MIIRLDDKIGRKLFAKFGPEAKDPFEQKKDPEIYRLEKAFYSSRWGMVTLSYSLVGSGSETVPIFIQDRELRRAMEADPELKSEMMFVIMGGGSQCG